MENNIKEAYVSLEVAQLLKEKGFAWYSTKLVNKDGKTTFENIDGVRIPESHGYPCYNDEGKPIRPNMFTPTNKHYPRPTHQMAIEWIRINFDTFIEIIVTTNKRFFARIYWEMSKTHTGMGNITYFDNQKQIDNDFKCYSTPQEATDAALLYTLQNLIK